MSVEERIRAAARAAADTVDEIRELELPAAAPVRGRGRRVPSARHWWTWAAPLAAAAAVIALALSLVLVRDTPRQATTQARPVISTSPVLSAPPPRPGPVPRYWAELRQVSGGQTPRQGLLIGDTFTGQTVAKVMPPAGDSFQSISAAADDRTFAILMEPADGNPQAAGTWYLLRLAPGTSSPVRLTSIPIQPISDVADTALSASGRELAVGTATGPAGTPWIGVYSVATGRLLHSWSNHGGLTFRIEGFGVGSNTESGLDQTYAMTWIQGDRAIAFIGVVNGGSTVLRRLEVAAKGSDIVKDSRVIWSSKDTSCAGGSSTTISADGKTVTCVTSSYRLVGKREADWTKRWLVYSIAAPTAAPRVAYQVSSVDVEPGRPGADPPWVSASGVVMLVEWGTAPPKGPDTNTIHFGMVSNGTFTPLKAPPATDASSGILGGPPGLVW